METDALTWRFDSFLVLPDSLQMQKDFLYVLASLHAKSTQPAAVEVVDVAKANGVLPMDVSGFQEYPGRGMGGLVTLPDEKHPRAVLLGSVDFLAQCRLQTPAVLQAIIRTWQSEATTLVSLAGWDGWVRGALKFKPR